MITRYFAFTDENIGRYKDYPNWIKGLVSEASFCPTCVTGDPQDIMALYLKTLSSHPRDVILILPGYYAKLKYDNNIAEIHLTGFKEKNIFTVQTPFNEGFVPD